MLIFIFYNTFCHLGNAEMTPELHDDLVNLSLDNLLDFFKITYPNHLRRFIVLLLNYLKTLVSIPSFLLMCSPYIYAFHDIAIIRCQLYFPNFSSWLRQDALWGPWEILFLSGIYPPSGESLSHKAGRIGCSGFSFPFDGGPFVYDPSLGRWAYYWRLWISPRLGLCWLLCGIVGESWAIGDPHFWSGAVCDSC